MCPTVTGQRFNNLSIIKNNYPIHKGNATPFPFSLSLSIRGSFVRNQEAIENKLN